MSLYADTLTPAERRALKKHTHDLQDEIDLLRILIRREMDPEEGDQDSTKIVEACEAIARLITTRHKLQAKPDDELKLAMMQAINQLDAEADQ